MEVETFSLLYRFYMFIFMIWFQLYNIWIMTHNIWLLVVQTFTSCSRIEFFRFGKIGANLDKLGLILYGIYRLEENDFLF